MTIWHIALKAGRVKNALPGLVTLQVTVMSQLHLHVFIACISLMTENSLGS